MNIASKIEKIKNTDFFAHMGCPNSIDESVIWIQNIELAFIHPQAEDFYGVYDQMKWLPTSTSDPDPFYDLNSKIPEELCQFRKQITQALMVSVRSIEAKAFRYHQHDFEYAAKNALYFAFRQALVEEYFNLGERWKKIIQLYYLGHWVIGFTQDKYIVI